MIIHSGADLLKHSLNLQDIDLDVPERIRVSTLRRLGMKPILDETVDKLEIPKGVSLNVFAIRVLRLYRRIRPTAIGNRCVFEPSCSRYSEMAFRTKPFASALTITLRRLHRCKPGNGGIDMNQIEDTL